MMAGERLGQWRKGLTSMSFPRWPRSAAAQGAVKAKSVPAVDPADIDIELADFQGMPRCYDSGCDSEDLLSSNVSMSPSLASAASS